MAFKKDLEGWAIENSNFKFCPRMTNTQGHVDADFIVKCVGDLSNSIFYVSRPPGMVGAVTKILEGLKISRDDISFEEFTGYN